MSIVCAGVELRRRAGPCGVVQHDQGGGGSARASAGGPAHPAGAVALRHRARIGSARELARLCEEHIAFQWLCGGVGMNAKTLADFRVAHGAVLEQLLVDSFAALLKIGAAKLDRVAQMACGAGGSRSGIVRRHSTLEVCQQAADERVRRLRAELDQDPGAASRRQAAARQRVADDARGASSKRWRSPKPCAPSSRSGHVSVPSGSQETAVAQPARQAEKPKPEAEKEPRASTTDAEARVMKMADGGFRPAYNVQFASDTTSGAIAGVAVDNSGSDPAFAGQVMARWRR